MASYYHPIGVSGNRGKPLYGYGPFPPYLGLPNVHHSYLHSYFEPFGANDTKKGVLSSAPSYNDILNIKREVPALEASVGASEISGGITSVMEYEPSTMACFLSWFAFSILKQYRKATAEFELAILSILHATRLPKLTIVIALEYMNQRFASQVATPLSDNIVFMRIVISLILANKFNDDNTFTNLSWSGATGLLTKAINREEAAWLKAVNWNLSVVPFRTTIKWLDQCWNTWLNQYSPKVSPYAPYPAKFIANYASAYTPSSPLRDYNYSQTSIASSPLAPSSQSNSNYINSEWQTTFNWSFGYTNPYLQPLIWAHKSSSHFGSETSTFGYGVQNIYYNCMASC